MSMLDRHMLFTGLESAMRNGGVPPEDIASTMDALDKLIELVRVTAAADPDTQMGYLHILLHNALGALQMGLIREVSILATMVVTIGSVEAIGNEAAHGIDLTNFDNALGELGDQLKDMGIASSGIPAPPNAGEEG